MPEDIAHDLGALAQLNLTCRMRMTEEMRAERASANPGAMGIECESVLDDRRAREGPVWQVTA